MTLRRWFAAGGLTLLLLAGCAAPPTKQDIGLATGALLGGVLGAQVGSGSGRTVGTIAGAALGAFLGSAIGKSMDDTDHVRTTRALETGRTGTATSWRNPDSGNSYTVTPTRTYETAGGPCREFTTVGDIGGRSQTVYGTACRQPDGSWKMG